MKVGVLGGAGSIGSRHSDNLVSLGHDVWKFDPTLVKSSQTVKRRDEVLEWADAIVICSPTRSHAADIHDCVAHKKHFLCEKPFGYDDPDLVSNIIQEANSNLIIATGFNLRFHHCVLQAHALLALGVIGLVQTAGFTVCQKTEKPVYLRDGILRNWCSHEIDLANHLLGPGGKVINCTAPADEHGNDTTEALLTMKFPSVERDVFIQADYYSDPERRYFYIEGEDGAIYVDLVKRHVFRKDKNGKKWQEFAGDDTFDQNYKSEMESFITSIEARSHHYPLGPVEDHQYPLATGADGVIALRQVLEARKLAGLND